MTKRSILKNMLMCSILSAFTLQAGSVLAASFVDLKVLVISRGSAEEDQGLYYISDLLDELHVPYDVLDSSREDLTADQLSDGERGFYNGVIVTEAGLYYTGEGNYLNSGFTLEEWQTLHAYERDFSIQESVLSGFPASGAYYKNTYDLDYGMDGSSIEGGSNFNGIWESSAKGTDIYEYINTDNSLPVTDYSVVAVPVPGGTNPIVEPLLIDQTSGKALVSKLVYADGRKVLYSGISNAWYLIHSQVLKYEFLNFATKGVFLGARKVHLTAHVDDLFLADGVWDPVTNTTMEEPGFRGSPKDIENLVASQQSLISAHPSLDNFKLDMVFNGGGALLAKETSLTADADTYIRERSSRRNYGSYTYGYFEQSWSDKRMLMHFPIEAGLAPSSRTVLNLSGKTDTREGSICKASEKWVEKETTWINARSGVSWSQRGGVYDSDSCVNFTLSGGRASVDVTAIVNSWLDASSPNYGFVIKGSNRNTGVIYTREHSDASKRPQLVISHPNGPLTESVVANKDEFRFINHTLTHMDMFASAGTTYEQAYTEIAENQAVWKNLGLPELDENLSVLVTGNHSGLDDTNGNEADPSVWTAYPEGMNTEFMAAAETVGIRYLASDSSRINQGEEAYVPGFNILLLPRYPTSMFYNVTTPEELADEYNYIYYERHVNQGLNPCTIPGAICEPRSYQEILEAEAETTLRHMLTYRTWPHYFHISNLREYALGSSLMFDWLNSAMNKYSEYLTLPVINDAYFDIGKRTEERVAAKEAGVHGQLDLTTNVISISASSDVKVEITGTEGGELYGGQRQNTINVGTTPVTIAVDRALTE